MVKVSKEHSGSRLSSAQNIHLLKWHISGRPTLNPYTENLVHLASSNWKHCFKQVEEIERQDIVPFLKVYFLLFKKITFSLVWGIPSGLLPQLRNCYWYRRKCCICPVFRKAKASLTYSHVLTASIPISASVLLLARLP